jgi:hypothetical protein
LTIRGKMTRAFKKLSMKILKIKNSLLKIISVGV